MCGGRPRRTMQGMLERLGRLSASRPRRTLLILFAFVVFAGLIGGPVAGRLSAGGGFTAKDSESARADAQLERATGEGTAAGGAPLVRGGGPPGGPRGRPPP